MSPPYRIGIADDHALFRQGLKSLLELQDDTVVVAETDRADEVAPMLAHTSCDLLLLDLQMDRNVLVDIPALAAHVRVIVVTASERPDDAVQAVKAGAQGVIMKRFAIETLMEAIRAVIGGEVWMPPSVQSYIAKGLRAAPVEVLTEREREVVRYVALGLRNAEVARKLFITEYTVKTHLNNIFQKIGVRDRVELTLYAARIGIIGVHDRLS
jgi:DNA-binding NarL/FixJ family response regulator